MDFSKALDVVSPSDLLDNLSCPQLVNCVTRMGEQLAHRLDTKGDSDWGDIRLALVTSGILHGSIHIPVLFNILINDLDA